MDIQVVVTACKAAITFQEPPVALEYLKMIMGLIKPEQFLDFIHAVATNPQAVEQARQMVAQCMGTPS